MVEQIGERIKKFALERCQSIRAFETSCGLTNGVVQRCTKGMNSDNIAKIAIKYPDLDLRWLILGAVENKQLSIFPPTEKEYDTMEREYKNALSIIKSQQDIINNLMNMKGI